MKVLFDTNVILDVWLRREPFWHASVSLMAMAEEKRIDGLLSPTSITTLHYLGKRVLGDGPVRTLIRELLAIFEVGGLDSAIIESSFGSKIADFEDAILEGFASHHGAEYIATRDIKDFRRSRIPAKEPIELIQENET